MLRLFALDVDTVSEEQLELCFSFIDPVEKERINRLMYKEDWRKAVCGRLLARFAISVFGGEPHQNLRFSRTCYGKPYLVHPKDIQFNLSHHGKWVICAVDELNVGCDLMTVEVPGRDKDQRRFIELMRPSLSVKEYENLVALSESPRDQLLTFFLYWMMKESYLKCSGIGLVDHLNQIECNADLRHLREGLASSVSDSFQSSENSIFKTGFLDESHIWSVCFKSNESNPQVEMISWEDLFNITLFEKH